MSPDKAIPETLQTSPDGQKDVISRKPFADPGGLDWGAQDAELQSGDWRRPHIPARMSGPLCASVFLTSSPRPRVCVSGDFVPAPAVGIAPVQLLVQGTLATKKTPTQISLSR